MERFKRQALLLAMLDSMMAKGSWCGETHVQKCAYFLEEGLEVPLGLNFILYKHGPFSFDLRETLGEMRGNFLIDLESRSPYGSSLVVSDSGRALKERFPRTIDEHVAEIEFVADRLSVRGVAELERLGTALYVMRQGPHAELSEQVCEITRLKPHIDDEAATAALQEVRSLITQAQSSG